MSSTKSVKAKGHSALFKLKLSITFLLRGVKLQFINLTGLNLYIVLVTYEHIYGVDIACLYID